MVERGLNRRSGETNRSVSRELGSSRKRRTYDVGMMMSELGRRRMLSRRRGSEELRKEGQAEQGERGTRRAEWDGRTKGVANRWRGW